MDSCPEEADAARVFPVSVMCEVLLVSRSGYYAYVQCLKKPKVDKDALLIESVKRTAGDPVFQDSSGSYGSRRISEQLKKEGHNIGRSKVRTLMKKAELVVKTKKKFKVTTNSNHNFPVSPNLLNQNFEVNHPNAVWVGDITYIWTAEGWLYLAVILDLFSRRIVGWAMDKRMKAELVESALKMAVRNRKPPVGLVFHSDRGSQYASRSYQELLQKYRMISSMSSVGNCYDNAVCERFFRSLKHEQTEYRLYRTRQEARLDIMQYIEWFYNPKRLHSTLGYVSPLQFEVEFLAETA